MKISFLYVNSYNVTGIPIGLAYLISILKDKGHEISVFETTFYDFDYTAFNINRKMDREGKKILSDFNAFIDRIKPDLIGISVSSLCMDFSIELINSFKDRPPTIFGGVGPTADYMDLIKKESVDYICVGYGEACLPRLVENLEKKTMLNDIPNLVRKEKGEIKVNEFSQALDLSNLPLPSWEAFDKRHFDRIFKRQIKKWGNFQLTRGCPFNCTYCINAYYHKKLGMKIYRFPPEKIIEEIRILSDAYNLDVVRIFDECFGFGDTRHYKKFAQIYKKTIKRPTIIETRPEAISPEMIGILKDINCISVSLGIEVGDPKQREEMLNRKVSNDIIKRAFSLLRVAGIRVSSYNIIGFPHDTREKIFETIKLNRECRPDFINVFTFCPDPKTELREYCLDKGLLATTAITAYGNRSIIRNENLSTEEIRGLYRAFEYYIKLPESFYPMIKKAERFDKEGDSALKLLYDEVSKRGLY